LTVKFEREKIISHNLIDYIYIMDLKHIQNLLKKFIIMKRKKTCIVLKQCIKFQDKRKQNQASSTHVRTNTVSHCARLTTCEWE